MSGHSKWSTIKHKKAAADSKRGQIFTKLGRAISLAAREGGTDPAANFKLRLAIDKARQMNMPKVNIDRAVDRGGGRDGGEALETVLYEGFGPGQVAVMVEAVTDNKNRTAAEMKKLFERGGGSLGQPGSVSYLFAKKGRLVFAAGADPEKQMLQLIDWGVDDVEAVDGGVEALVAPGEMAKIRHLAVQSGLEVKTAELIYKPLTLMTLDESREKQLTEWLDSLEDHDDVQTVYTNW